MKRIVVLLGLLCSACFGQNISGSLSGTVQDASGSSFAAAEVRLNHSETGFLRTTTTNSEGFFSFPDLRPGIYNLEVRAAGFKAHHQDGIEVNSGDSRSTGVIKMELGA